MFCTIQLSKSDPTPLYIQLANELSKLIKTGTLSGGIKLPTIRSLSKQLHINRDTVVNAYKVLENQGLILAHVGKGTYVSHTSTTVTSPDSPTPCTSLGFPRHFFSKQLLSNLTQDIVMKEGWHAFSDPLHREKNNLRLAIKDFFYSVGLSTHLAQIRLTHQFTDFLLELLKVHPEHCICVEAYHDLTYTSFLRSLGIKLIEIPITPTGLCLDTLKKVLKKHPVSFVWVSTYCQNPTGVTYSDDTKKELLTLADTYDFYLLEDGTYSDFVYDYHTLNPLFNANSDRVIYIHHFSKLYLPHLTYSFIALPSGLSQRILEPREYTFNERIVLFYLQSEYFSALRLQCIQDTYYYHQQLIHYFASLSDYFELYEPQSGLFLFIRPLKHSVEHVVEHFFKHHLIVSPSALFTTKNKSLYLRLSCSHLTPSILESVLYTLKSFTVD